MILVVTLCLLAQPDRCETFREPLLAEVTPFQCFLKAQEALPRVMDLYGEGYRIRAWGCERR